MRDNGTTLREFFDRVWNTGDTGPIDEFVGDSYTVFDDPGDPWDGQRLDREAFKNRLTVSRRPFPDLAFTIGEMVCEGDRVVVSWIMRGTQSGPMGDRPPTGRSIEVKGMTIYYFEKDRIVGHRQVVDRLTVAQQLGLLG